MVTLILALSVVLAQSSQFGTQVDENWYDKMALLFQTPTIVPNSYGTDPDYTPLSSGGALVNDRSEASFPSLYEPLRFAAYVGPNADGKGGVLILTNPSIAEIKATGQKIGTVPNSVCYLLGEAAIGERIIRNSVMNLENAVGNEELKTAIVSLGKQDRVYVEYDDATYTRPERLQQVVAIAESQRVGAEKIVVDSTSVQVSQSYTKYTTYYRAEFSLSSLLKAGAIKDGKVTFQHGWRKSDFCSFDLNKLP